MRLAPLTDREAADFVHAPRGARLLDGYRGRPACDIAAVIDVLQRLSQLAADMPDVAEVECNPLVARPGGAAVVDQRVRVAPAQTRPPSWLRAIRSTRTTRFE
jgi:succinyl-CoA synthetase beta subunit